MKINFMTNEIEVTKSFLKKARYYGSLEYETLVKVKSELPGFRITLKAGREKEHYKVA